MPAPANPLPPSEVVKTTTVIYPNAVTPGSPVPAGTMLDYTGGIWSTATVPPLGVTMEPIERQNQSVTVALEGIAVVRNGINPMTAGSGVSSNGAGAANAAAAGQHVFGRVLGATAPANGFARVLITREGTA